MKRLKKPLTLVLALMMALGLLSVNAGAGWVEDQPDGAVVEWTDSNNAVKYETAFPTSLDAGTYKLLADATVSAQVKIDLASAKNVTLDLNGRTLTSTSSSPREAFSVVGNNSEDSQGKFDLVSTTEGGVLKIDAAQFGLDIDGQYNEVNIGKGVAISSSTSSTDYGVFVWGTHNTLNVEGTVNTHEFEATAIQTHGSSTHYATINIKDGAYIYSAGDCAMYIPGEGSELNISGGEIIGATGVYVKTGKLTVTGGSIKGIGEATNYVFNGSGANSTGAALVIDNCGYPGGFSGASITGGTFESVNGTSVQSYAKPDSGLTAITDFISGGQFVSKGEADTSVVAYLKSDSGYKSVDANGNLSTAASTDTPAAVTANAFAVTLQQSEEDKHKDVDGNGYNEANAGETVTYDIMLTSTEKGNLKVNALEFKLNIPSGMSFKEAKFGNVAYVKNGQDVYTAETATDGSQDATTGAVNAAVAVGSISFTIDSGFAASNTDNSTNKLNPKMTAINLLERGNPIPVTVDDVATIKVEVNPVYTITLKNKQNNADNGKIEAAADTTLSYSFTNGVTLADGATLNAYTFQNWKVTGTPTSETDKTIAGTNWKVDDTYTSSIGAGQVGAVTLEAVYDVIVYDVTFDYANGYNGGATAVRKNVTDPTTYTIEQIATGDYFTFTTIPTRKGFDFLGYEATQTTGATHTGYSWPTALVNSASDIVGSYGDVTLTAQWKVAGDWKAVDYAYTRTGDSLVLFAVKSDDLINGVYHVNETAMFKLNTAKYKGAFKDDNGNVTVADNDTIFGYIMRTPTAEPTFTITEGTTTNEKIAYKGNVYHGDSVINAGDYGNVNTLLGDNDAFTYGSLDVRARLEADMGVKTDDGAEALAHYGSIDDIKAIINEAGKSVNE